MKALLLSLAALALLAALSFKPLMHALVGYETAPCADHPSEVMRAVYYDEHGDESVLKYTDEYPMPVPGTGQVLVQIKAASVNPCDFKMRRNLNPLIPKPKIPGEDIAGVVVWAPEGSTFSAGDRVAAMLPIVGTKWGASAEYAGVHEHLLARIPQGVSFADAASLPLVALTVLDGLDRLDGDSHEGKRILIQAGAGGLGTFAIQYCAKVLGMEVTTTCSTRNVEKVKALGATRVIDYTKQDFSEVVTGYDVVLDTMAYMYERKTMESNVLKPNGGHYIGIMGSHYTQTSAGVEDIGDTLGSYARTVWLKVKAMLGQGHISHDMITVTPNGAKLQRVMDAVASGQVKAVIDRTFALADVAEAHKYVATGRARGKVIIEM